MTDFPFHPKATEKIRAAMRRDETLLWSGMPRQGVVFGREDIFWTSFGAIFFSFAVYWIVFVLMKDDTPLIAALWGIPFVIVGFNLFIGRYFIEANKRANTFFGLTDRRAVVLAGKWSLTATSVPLRNLTGISKPTEPESTGMVRPTALGKTIRLGQFRDSGRLNDMLWPLASDLLPSDYVVDDPGFTLHRDAERVAGLVRGALEAIGRAPRSTVSHAVRNLPLEPEAASDIRETLEPNERLLCAVKPKQGPIFNLTDDFAVAIITLFIVIVASSAIAEQSEPALSPVPTDVMRFLLLPLGIPGLYYAYGTIRRSRTSYGLTDRRAVVVSGVWSRRVKSLPFNKIAAIAVRRRSNGRGTLFTAAAPKRIGWLRYFMPWRTKPAQLIFQQIREPQRIHDAALERILASPGGP